MEDHCTLWSWITFSWVNDLLSIKSLEEKDLWSLSPSLRSRLLLRKFLQISCSAEENTTSKVKNKASLLYLLFRANSKDLIIDFGLTLFSSSLAYTNPFFLNKILRTISETQNQLERSRLPANRKLIFTLLLLLLQLWWRVKAIYNICSMRDVLRLELDPNWRPPFMRRF